MTTKTEKEYSMKYHAVKAREYNEDAFKYAILKMRNIAFIQNKYNSEDDDIKTEFRKQRAIINQKYYLNRKERLTKEAKIKANIAL
jgi:hypothetical protein